MCGFCTQNSGVFSFLGMFSLIKRGKFPGLGYDWSLLLNKPFVITNSSFPLCIILPISTVPHFITFSIAVKKVLNATACHPRMLLPVLFLKSNVLIGCIGQLSNCNDLSGMLTIHLNLPQLLL